MSVARFLFPIWRDYVTFPGRIPRNLVRPGITAQENIPSRTDAAAYRQWLESEAGLARSRAQRSYQLRLEADGMFRLEDVLSGIYILTVIVDPSGRRPEPPIGYERLTREIVVPEMPGGRSDNPLDLGVIDLQIPIKK